MRGDDGQTVGIYIVALTALFFLAFAYFAVGQAAVSRNTTQTAADAAALAAAREGRDALHDAVLTALGSGDPQALKALLAHSPQDVAAACGKASAFAADNGAEVDDCGLAPGADFGFTVKVTSRSSVGSSVVKGSEDVYPTAEATAVVEPRCSLDGLDGTAVRLACDQGSLTVDPTAGGFVLDLSALYTVHLSK
ncbi:pilus assembly protein TadG-related protein [Streptomyces sp. NRRL F-5123]|uniref:pilus assembly protein TadG-related protein n=1 Tax=Streptomyces sp. NRRL F-5123 TaxID=1463856 RepID=UPI0004E1629F|nr:pilus assembly protein TadG-related protein [Streptomyces sp. NRRL F-5123]